jgi:DNA-directed RNA polymerase subunit H
MFKITEHELVPKHEILSEQEKKALFARFNITEEKLPRIFVTDPVIKAIGAKIGDVIKITRTSPTAGRSVYYRIVVEEEKRKPEVIEIVEEEEAEEEEEIE